jgi:hypothetical protein
MGTITRRVLVAADTESTLALLSGLRGEVWVRIRGGRGGMRLEQAGIGPVTLDGGTFDADLDLDIGPVGKLVFGHVSKGAVGYRTDRAERWHGNGVAYVAPQPGRCRTAMFRGGLHEQAVMDPALPGQMAATEPGRAERPVRFTGYDAISVQAARTWRHTYAYARDIVADLPDAAGQQLVVSGVARLLVATALATFPNNGMTATWRPCAGRWPSSTTTLTATSPSATSPPPRTSPCAPCSLPSGGTWTPRR